MFRTKLVYILGTTIVTSLIFSSCSVPFLVRKSENKAVPSTYTAAKDSANVAGMAWKEYFTDPYLNALIDSALKNNQGLNMAVQDINIAKSEVRARKGQYLPFLNLMGGVGVDKQGRYTRLGAVDANSDIKPGQSFPDPLPDFTFAATASWEIDIWKKLRNAKKSAMLRYLSTTEGKNFMVTTLVAEIANDYYELMALDNQLQILRSNIEIQQSALEIVIQLKAAAKVTELAVKRFEAEVSKNQSRQYYILQQIVEAENRINFLVGRFPQTVSRNTLLFSNLTSGSIPTGTPSQLLENRPDIKQAELELSAAKLDVKSAKASFYPSLMISGGVGFEAFAAKSLLTTPESMFYSLAGSLVAPLINRNAIKAYYYAASARQTQTIFKYERTILNGYIEVANQLANINNLEKSYDLKSKQVDALTTSIKISTGLFQSARADYMEVLLTQRDALESKFELTEIKKQQMHARVNIYQALGGGWK